MRVLTKDSAYGDGGLELHAESEVIDKKSRSKRYAYCKKIGKRYYMTNALSLQYLAAILWTTHADSKHLVFCLRFGNSFITCVYDGRKFNCDIDPDIAEEVYVRKFRDMYFGGATFRLYSNTQIQFPGRDVIYLSIDDEVIRKAIKTSISPHQLVLLIVMAIITIIMLRLLYIQVIHPKGQRVQARAETAEELFEQSLRLKLTGAAAKAGFLMNVALPPNERITVIDGDNITVESLIAKPSYVQDGLLYKKTYNYATLPVKQSRSTLQVPSDLSSCSPLVSNAFRVVDYRTEQIKGKPYQFAEALLEANLHTLSDLRALVEDSLRHCVVIRNIRYTKEGGFTVEASKFSRKDTK